MFTVPAIRIGEPNRYKSLTVFPLFAETNGQVEYLLSDEAIQVGAFTVQEVSEGGSVPDLLVENSKDIRVLFLEGEELVGAKQNRTALPHVTERVNSSHWRAPQKNSAAYRYSGGLGISVNRSQSGSVYSGSTIHANFNSPFR
jgi:hypothetical protein